MTNIPFEIPESLSSYVKTFEESPEKGISNLENYLGKRRNDAVGYFLLAILYTSAERQSDALKAASRARSLAPGSHLLEHLHYFLRHPDGFNAWVPKQAAKETESGKISQRASTIAVDLDVLITRLTRAGGKRIAFDANEKTDNRGSDDSVTDQLATPTLAGIYESQNKMDEAIRVYERLMELRPKYKSIYEDEVARIRDQMN